MLVKRKSKKKEEVRFENRTRTVNRKDKKIKDGEREREKTRM